MGVGRITDAREVTQGVVHAAHDGAGESAGRIAAIGAHAGREAQRTVAAGLGDAAKNIGDTLKVVGDFAVKALWEKPIAEAEEKIRELDLKCRTEGWEDDKGHHDGFDIVKGAKAANIGNQWEAYMERKAREISAKYGLTEGQRQELSTRTRKLRVETKARLTERGTRELITSNLADIDIIATKDGERNVMQAVANANESVDKFKESVGLSGDAEKAAVERGRDDNAAAVSISDQLVTKRNELIRRKIEGGLGFKSEALATAEADKIVRAEALSTVTALARAGHYDRARKLVEQGKRAVDSNGTRLFDDAALAKGRELVDGMEVDAAVNEANVAISAIRNADGSYPNDRVETIERSIATLKRVGAAQKKDSKLAASAAEAVAKLDKHADTIRVGEFFDGFDQSQIGRLDLEKAKNPYKKGTRDARCWDTAKRSWLKEETEEYRRNRTEVLGMSGILAEESVAAGSPQAYLEWLDKQVEAGRLMPSDRKAEKRKFMNGWMKSPEMQQRAAAMLRAVKDKLNIDFGAAIKKDDAGLPKLSKSGLLQVEKGATLPEIGYERMERLGLLKFFRPELNDRIVRRERFSGADFKAIMDYSLQFAIADGLNVPVGNIPDDLQWLVSDEDRKKGSHRVNCVNDFRAFLDRLSQRDKVLGAKEEFSSATKKLYLERAMH